MDAPTDRHEGAVLGVAAPADSANQKADRRSRTPPPARRKRAKVPFSFVYPDVSDALTLEHMALMRDLAVTRDKNKETAMVSLLNVAFGMNALQACLDGEVVLQIRRNLDAVKSVQIRQKWQWAARKIMLSNRLIRGSKQLVIARRNGMKKDLYLGYMITNFNHLTFENGDALELLLDWFDAANKVFKLPEQLMQRLLKDNRQEHTGKMIRAEQVNAKAEQLDRQDAERKDLLRDESIESRRPKMFVGPWDEDLARDTIKRESAPWRVVNDAAKLMWAIGAAQERYAAKMRQVGRLAMLNLIESQSNSVIMTQTHMALEAHLMALKEASIGLDNSLEVLRNPDAKPIQSYDEMASMAAALKQQRAVNKILHDNICQLTTEKQELQDEMDRRVQTMGQTIFTLRASVATMQDDLDRRNKSILDLQDRYQFLKNVNADLEATLQGLASVQESSAMLHLEIRELKMKVADRDDKLVELSDLRMRLAEAQGRVNELVAQAATIEAERAEFLYFRMTSNQEKAALQRDFEGLRASVEGLEGMVKDLKHQCKEGMTLGLQGVANDAKSALRRACEECEARLTELAGAESSTTALELALGCTGDVLAAALSPLEGQGMESVEQLTKNVLYRVQRIALDVMAAEFDKGGLQAAARLGAVDFEREKAEICSRCDAMLLEGMRAMLSALNDRPHSRDDGNDRPDETFSPGGIDADAALRRVSAVQDAVADFFMSLSGFRETDDVARMAEGVKEALCSKLSTAIEALLAASATSSPGSTSLPRQSQRSAQGASRRSSTTQGTSAAHERNDASSDGAASSGLEEEVDFEVLVDDVVLAFEKLVGHGPSRHLLVSVCERLEALLPPGDDDQAESAAVAQRGQELEAGVTQLLSTIVASAADVSAAPQLIGLTTEFQSELHSFIAAEGTLLQKATTKAVRGELRVKQLEDLLTELDVDIPPPPLVPEADLLSRLTTQLGQSGGNAPERKKSTQDGAGKSAGRTSGGERRSVRGQLQRSDSERERQAARIKQLEGTLQHLSQTVDSLVAAVTASVNQQPPSPLNPAIRQELHQARVAEARMELHKVEQQLRLDVSALAPDAANETATAPSSAPSLNSPAAAEYNERAAGGVDAVPKSVTPLTDVLERRLEDTAAALAAANGAARALEARVDVLEGGCLDVLREALQLPAVERADLNAATFEHVCRQIQEMHTSHDAAIAAAKEAIAAAAAAAAAATAAAAAGDKAAAPLPPPAADFLATRLSMLESLGSETALLTRLVPAPPQRARFSEQLVSTAEDVEDVVTKGRSKFVQRASLAGKLMAPFAEKRASQADSHHAAVLPFFPEPDDIDVAAPPSLMTSRPPSATASPRESHQDVDAAQQTRGRAQGHASSTHSIASRPSLGLDPSGSSASSGNGREISLAMGETLHGGPAPRAIEATRSIAFAESENTESGQASDTVTRIRVDPNGAASAHSPPPKVRYASTVELLDARESDLGGAVPSGDDEDADSVDDSWRMSRRRPTNRTTGVRAVGGAARSSAQLGDGRETPMHASNDADVGRRRSYEGVVEGVGIEQAGGGAGEVQGSQPRGRSKARRAPSVAVLGGAQPQNVAAFAPYGNVLPWRFTEPELPSNWALRAERASPSRDESPAGLKQVFAHLAGREDTSELKAKWLMQLSDPDNTDAFDRMKSELSELNTLYGRALQSAQWLAKLNEAGLLDDAAMQQLQAVDGSPLMVSIAAMDAIAALDPLRALASQSAQSFEQEVEACYSALIDDVSKWMDTMQSMPMMQRNRRTLEATLRARATTIVKERRAREDKLSYTKRVDRSSVFIPESALRESSRQDAQNGRPMRWAKHNWKHGAVFSSLCDTDPALCVTPPPPAPPTPAGAADTAIAEPAEDCARAVTPQPSTPTSSPLRRTPLAVATALFDARSLRGRRRHADHQGRPRVYQARRTPSRSPKRSGSALPPLDKRGCMVLDHRAIAAAAQSAAAAAGP